MIALYATGYADYHHDDRPTLTVSPGAGNTAAEEVHVEFWDAEEGARLMGWFNKADLLAAIQNPTGEQSTNHESEA